MYVYIAIASSFFAAIASVFARTILKDIKAKQILSLNFLLMFGALLVGSPLFFEFEVSAKSVLCLAFIALLDTAGNYAYFKTFEASEASVATPLLSLAPVFTFIFSWWILDERVSLQILICCTLLVAAILIFSFDFANVRSFSASTMIPALCSSVLFGVSAIPSKYLLKTISATNPATLYMFRAGLIGCFAFLIFRESKYKYEFNDLIKIGGRSLFVITQWVLLYTAIQKGNSGVAVTLSNITPIFVFIFASIFLREKITSKKVVASLLVFVLAFLINIVQ